MPLFIPIQYPPPPEGGKYEFYPLFSQVKFVLLFNTYKMSCRTTLFDRLKIYPIFLDFTSFYPLIPTGGGKYGF